MNYLIRYLIFIYYVPKINLFYRILFIVKRKILQIIFNKIGNRYLSFSSKLSLRQNVPKGNILNSEIKKKSLPIEANLFGYCMRIDKNINWYPENLNYGIFSERLVLHYMDYLKELKFEDSLFLIKKWILEVRPYTSNYWKDSWQSYGLSIRVINWIDLISGNASFINHFDNSSFQLINKSIEYQVDFLLNNLEVDLCGNHLIKNIRCIFRACSYFKGRKIKIWFKKISYYLFKELDNQFLSDGMHYELSPSYHNSVAEDLICIKRSLNSLSDDLNPKVIKRINQKINSVLKEMYFVTLRLTHPDGFPSLFSDSGLNSCTKPLVIAKKIKAVLDIPNQLNTLDKCEVWKLDDSGFYGLRSKDSCFITKCGDLGADSLPGHGQSDSLSFEWSVEGFRIIVDQGVFTYHPGIDRDFSKSTRSHNTLTLNNLDQSDCWSSFKVGRRARTKVTHFKELKNGFCLKAFHDGYEYLRGNPLVYRKMNITLDKLFFEDIVNSNPEDDYEVKNRILLAPNIDLEKIKNTNNKKEFQCLLKIKRNNKSSKDLLFLLTSDHDFMISDTNWFPDFGVKLKTKRIIFDLGNTPCKSNWSIVKL